MITSDSTSITITGVYKGQNLYVQNPFSPGGAGFCTIGVRVNGNVTNDDTGSSAFEVNLRVLGLSFGDAVEVRIDHKPDCMPKILNPDAVSPPQRHETIYVMEMSSDGDISSLQLHGSWTPVRRVSWGEI